MAVQTTPLLHSWVQHHLHRRSWNRSVVNSFKLIITIRWMISPSAQLQQWTGSTQWHPSNEWFPNQSDTATSEQPQLNNSYQMNDFPISSTVIVDGFNTTTVIRWMISQSVDTATSEQPQLNDSHQMNDFPIYTLLHQHSPVTFLLITFPTLFSSRLVRSVGWADIEVKFHPVEHCLHGAWCLLHRRSVVLPMWLMPRWPGSGVGIMACVYTYGCMSYPSTLNGKTDTFLRGCACGCG